MFGGGNSNQNNSVFGGNNNNNTNNNNASSFFQQNNNRESGSVYDVYKARITQIYQAKKPDHISKIDALLNKARGQEHQLYVKICKKYNVQQVLQPYQSNSAQGGGFNNSIGGMFGGNTGGGFGSGFGNNSGGNSASGGAFGGGNSSGGGMFGNTGSSGGMFGNTGSSGGMFGNTSNPGTSGGMFGNYGQHPDNSSDPKALPEVTGINYRDVFAENVTMAGRMEGIPNDPYTGICMSNVTAQLAPKAKKLQWNYR
eukprot:UN06910